MLECFKQLDHTASLGAMSRDHSVEQQSQNPEEVGQDLCSI